MSLLSYPFPHYLQFTDTQSLIHWIRSNYLLFICPFGSNNKYILKAFHCDIRIYLRPAALRTTDRVSFLRKFVWSMWICGEQMSRRKGHTLRLIRTCLRLWDATRIYTNVIPRERLSTQEYWLTYSCPDWADLNCIYML